MPASKAEKEAFIEKYSRWIMPDQRDPTLAADARMCTSLDHVYDGQSQKIHRLIRLAYLRGVRRGVSLVWEGQQPITLRETADELSGDESSSQPIPSDL